MTAVEWLVEKLELNVFESDEEVLEVIEEALEMEKKRLLDFAGIISVAVDARRGTQWTIKQVYNEFVEKEK